MSSMKKRGLGRGLDALLGDSALARDDNRITPAALVAAQGLAVDLISRSRFQPRQDFNQEALQELADSIRAQGVVQPIVVRPFPGQTGRYELIAGERRWRATQLAGLHQIPAVIRDVDDQAAMAMALIENIQREALNPIEEAAALHRLIDEFGLTHEQTAEAVGRSRTAVTNLLRLLQLEPPVKELLQQHQLEMGHARALLGLQGAAQIRTARDVAKHELSVRETEALVKRTGHKPLAKAKSSIDPDTQRLQDSLSGKLGTQVELQHNSHGKGKLVIHYHSLDELDGILDHIK
ncbi:MAG: ParB/RepB/Spo0J family partition protein [Gammaproteobacteria bacterium]|nr:ParB/RepB/Spo0J family partition protein [Gammaproteobacteria bacterium]